MTLAKFDRINAGLAALIGASSVAAYALLPAGQPIAVHFDADGAANGWASPAFALAILPGLALVNLAVQRALPAIDPRGDNLRRSAHAYGTVWVAAMLMLLLAQALIVATAFGARVHLQGLALAASGLLFVVVGNVLGKLRWNCTVGIRTPWTIADERVWDQTHRFGGKLFVGCGAVLLAALPLSVSTEAQARLVVVAALVAAGGSTWKSYWLWKRGVASSR